MAEPVRPTYSPDTPHLKGHGRDAQRRGESRCSSPGCPGYTAVPRLANGKTADPDAPALRFDVFVDELLAWVAWWNGQHGIDVLVGRTPLQAWLDDPTPLTTVPGEDLRLFTLEDDGRVRTITGKGVQWRTRFYVGAWMNGSANAGRQVRVRWMPKPRLLPADAYRRRGVSAGRQRRSQAGLNAHSTESPMTVDAGCRPALRKWVRECGTADAGSNGSKRRRVGVVLGGRRGQPQEAEAPPGAVDSDAGDLPAPTSDCRGVALREDAVSTRELPQPGVAGLGQIGRAHV